MSTCRVRQIRIIIIKGRNGFLTHHGDRCAVVRQPKIDVKRKWISDAPWRSLCCGASA
ncbi:hypothetical protein ACOKW7_04955 [Limnospira platensis CENA597]|uniref:hypothetical protein n=1 Tax=Oscillatoriales TaxID=1150 RepID=UPI00396F71F9